MRVFRSLESVPDDFGPCAVTIGNFDGVHAAHRQIMRRAVEAATRNGWTSAVLTFDPHPAKLLAPSRAPRLLTTLAQRCALIEEQGIDEVLILPFTQEISKFTAEQFVEELLVKRLQARLVLVGDNFRFGHRAAGDTALLRRLGAQLGFSTEIAGTISSRGKIVSSSTIRHLIESGDVSRACRMLERPHFLEGRVVPGRGIGSKQTVPTLNLETGAEVLPKTGIYVTRTHDLDDARQWPSVTSVGFNPTFNGDRLTIETFLLSNFDGGTPKRIRVEFLRRIRDERKFESAEALKREILHDVGRAQAWFRRLGRFRADHARYTG